jgi:DNA-binding Xre family transcriptional regulator
MAVSYKKLWHLLIDKDMKRQDLQKMSGLSPASMAKLSKGDTVTTVTLEKICKALACDISDIMEIIHDADEPNVRGDAVTVKKRKNTRKG